MRRDGSSISGEKTRHPKQRKRKPQSDHSESSLLPESETRSRSEQLVTEKSPQKPETPQRKSGERLRVRSVKRARTGLEQPSVKPTAKANTEAQPFLARTRHGNSKVPSSRQSRRLVKDSRSVSLSAEPPPARRPIVTPPTEKRPAQDPDFDLKRRAREDFRETGDYRAFHTLLAPFRKGNTQKELSDWVFNEEKQRWWREDKSTGLIIWAPTSDSFL